MAALPFFFSQAPSEVSGTLPRGGASGLALPAQAVELPWLDGVWRAGEVAGADTAVLDTGYAPLNCVLPGGGWPVGAMTEVLQLVPGRGGEWGLLAPALGLLGLGSTQAQTQAAFSPSAATVLVGAPYMPFGPALAARRVDPQQLLWVHADQPAARLWAAEQALRCADVQVVLAWLPRVQMPQLQRLHRAAQTFGKLLFVFRPQSAQQESSPAPLRLLLCHAPPDNLVSHGASTALLTARLTATLLQVHVFKRRGPPLLAPVEICPLPAELQALLAASRTQSRRRRAASSVGRVPGTELKDGKESAHALDRLAAAC